MMKLKGKNQLRLNHETVVQILGDFISETYLKERSEIEHITVDNDLVTFTFPIITVSLNAQQVKHAIAAYVTMLFDCHVSDVEFEFMEGFLTTVTFVPPEPQGPTNRTRGVFD